MSEKIEIDDRSGVDKGLVAMFLRMSPKERLRANDNAFRTILELRDAYRRQKANEYKRKIATGRYTAESKYDLPNS
jgi:hypothetical protein